MKGKTFFVSISVAIAALIAVMSWGLYLDSGFHLYDKRLDMIRAGDPSSKVVEVMGAPSRIQGPGENVGPSTMNEGVAQRFLYLAPAIPIDWAAWLVDFDGNGKVIAKWKLVFP